LRRLLCYWTLKRQSRFGVPLLRRLQVCQTHKSAPEVAHFMCQPSILEAARFLVQQRDLNDVKENILYWKKVRRDLEKTRLLVELLRKREQRKKDLVSEGTQNPSPPSH